MKKLTILILFVLVLMLSACGKLSKTLDKFKDFDYKQGYRTGYVRGSSMCSVALAIDIKGIPPKVKAAMLKGKAEKGFHTNNQLGGDFVRGYNKGLMVGYEQNCTEKD